MQKTQQQIQTEIDKLRATQADRDARIQSFQTDEDDCFVSAHYNAQAINRLEMELTLLNCGGRTEFRDFILTDLNGQPLPAICRLVPTNFGSSLVCEMDSGETLWVNPWVKRAATHEKKGYRIAYATYTAPAYVGRSGGGQGGLYGAMDRTNKFKMSATKSQDIEYVSIERHVYESETVAASK